MYDVREKCNSCLDWQRKQDIENRTASPRPANKDKKLYILTSCIRIICVLIPYRPWRKQVRSFLTAHATDIIAQITSELSERKLSDFIFLSHTVPPNTVLLVEPNNFHGVILPGFVNYFQAAGYNVEVLLRPKVLDDNPFIRMKTKRLPVFFKASFRLMKKFLHSKKMKGYEFIFLTTSYYRHAVFQNTYIRFLGFEPQGKNGVLLVEHDMGEHFNEANEQKYVDSHRLFSLSGFKNTQKLNPHYFGETNPKKKNAKTNFIIVGHPGTRSYETLLEPVRTLIQNGNSNFVVTAIGARDVTFGDDIAPYIDIKGWLSFEEMYTEIENADFILFLLDSSNKLHRKYIHNVTSGTMLLSLGFRCPPIIEQSFASGYGFTRDNAIIYNGEDLLDAMTTAMCMDSKEYDSMCDALDRYSDEIYSQSLDTLKNALSIIENTMGRRNFH